MPAIRPLRFIRPLFLPRDKNNAEFWLSHALIIASTILGVYLAASAGYRAAVDFEAVKADRDGYYLQMALLSELDDNLEHVETWAKKFADRGYSTFAGRPEEFQLETFVWDSMTTSDATFKVPPEVLTGIRRFYRRTAGNLTRMTDSNPRTEPDLSRMIEDAAEARKQVVPALSRNIERLRRRLEHVEVPLG